MATIEIRNPGHTHPCGHYDECPYRKEHDCVSCFKVAAAEQPDRYEAEVERREITYIARVSPMHRLSTPPSRGDGGSGGPSSPPHRTG